MNIPSSPAVYAPVLPAFQTIGQKPVGLESVEGRKIGSRPVERTPETKRPAVQTGKAASLNGKTLDDSGAQSELHNAKNQLESRKEQLVRQQIQQMAQRDREVRAHEQAHMAAGGAHAGAAHYEYARGPDGVSYAVSGEVPIDSGPAATPEATLEKAQILIRAALAPSDPSSQDRNVAADAARLEMDARRQIAAQQIHRSQAAAAHIERTRSEQNTPKPATAGESTNKSGETDHEGRFSGDMASQIYKAIKQPAGDLLNINA